MNIWLLKRHCKKFLSKMIKYDPNERMFVPTKLLDESVFSGFSTRQLGDGVKVETLFHFFKNNGLPFGKVVVLDQIHSTNICKYKNKDKDDFEKISETDGIVSSDSDIVFVIRTADCLPILFYDPVSKTVGASHQGWRGSKKKMAFKMVEAMVSQGADKKSIRAAIGPAINDCCYEISPELFDEFLIDFNGYSKQIFSLRKNRIYLNLVKFNFLQLIQAGLSTKNIDFFPFCTYCDRERFFSYRRDKTKEGFAEMFSFISKRQIASNIQAKQGFTV